jgi:hypothetical protein
LEQAAILAAIWILVGSQLVPIAMEFHGTYDAAEMASKGEYAKVYDAAAIEEDAPLDDLTLAEPAL